MNTKRDLLSKDWFLVSYNNLDTSLISGLRINRLHSFLKQKEVNVKLITRSSNTDSLSEIISIPEKKLVRKNKRFFNLITPPDSSSIWALSVFNYLKQKDSSVILTTIPSFGVVLIGLLLRLFRTRHYWIVDFRDSWLSNPVYKPALYWYKKLVAFILEFVVLKTADLVLINTYKDRENFVKKYPFLKGKSLVVRNGFDQRVENRASKKNTQDSIKIVYSGTAYHRGIAAINIAKFLTKLNNAGLSISCDYYGEFHSSIELSPFINYKGLVNSDQIPKILSSYKIGIIYLQQECIGGGRVTQKFYDYLGSGVSPVVLNPSEEMGKAIQSLKFGLEIYPDSPIEKTIVHLRSIYFADLPSIPTAEIAPYTRDYQFNKFYKYLSQKNQ